MTWVGVCSHRWVWEKVNPETLKFRVFTVDAFEDEKEVRSVNLLL